MKADKILLDHMCNVIKCYQEFMVDVRYRGNKYGDPIWKHNKETGAYGFVPTKDIIELIKILITILSYLKKKSGLENISLLDAGCGVGNILLIAKVLGFSDVYGIEFDVNTIKIAKRLSESFTASYNYSEENFHIIKADLSKYDKYENYDVIYYYQPINPGSKQMGKFLSLVKENMKIGAIVVTNGTNPFKKDKRFRNIIRSVELSNSDGVYEKMR